MTALFVALAILLVLLGIAGTVIPGLPGAVLVLAGVFWLAWLDSFERIGVATLVVLTLLTVVFHAVDLLAASVAARRLGASRRAVVGAAIGTLAGLFFGLPGVVIGPFVGAFVGEFTKRGVVAEATRVGFGTWLGLLVGAVFKLTLVFMMVGIAAIAFIVG